MTNIVGLRSYPSAWWLDSFYWNSFFEDLQPELAAGQ